MGDRLIGPISPIPRSPPGHRITWRGYKNTALGPYRNWVPGFAGGGDLGWFRGQSSL